MGRIVVLDTETTGLDPNKSDLIQIACIVLKPDFTPDKFIQPFYLMIKPAHYREGEDYVKEIQPAMSVNKLELARIIKDGFDPTVAAELWEEYWKSLGGQQLDLLCQNYPFDSSFVKAWLGPISFSHYFSRYYRDTYVAAKFLCDRADFENCKVPFNQGLSLSKLASVLGIQQDRAHDALSDCVTTAEVYKRLCTLHPVPVEVKRSETNG